MNKMSKCSSKVIQIYYISLKAHQPFKMAFLYYANMERLYREDAKAQKRSAPSLIWGGGQGAGDKFS
jgi:hypothetical protein